jgi:parvulin-like peptidyl-prolyl isomerase
VELARGDQPVAATVDGAPILVAQVRQALAQAQPARPLTEREQALIEAEALDQLIRRALVEKAIAHLSPSPTEIDQALARLQAQLAAQQLPFEQFLAQRKQSAEEFRRLLAWQLTWERHLAEHLTESRLEACFAAHRRELDGTRLKVSHILLRPQQAGEAPGSPQALERARALREQIATGKLSFEQAAETHSDGPSRRQGGDLGWMPRHGLMAEPFAQAAFALAEGELSPPVVTTFGVHLIKVTGVAAGEKTAADVAGELRTLAAQQLFDELAAQRRAAAKVAFTGAAPYFRPGTREVVLPQASR